MKSSRPSRLTGPRSLLVALLGAATLSGCYDGAPPREVVYVPPPPPIVVAGPPVVYVAPAPAPRPVYVVPGYYYRR